MDESDFFAIDRDRLHRFVTRDELGDDVISALQSDLAMTVGETVLPIAHWEHDRTGPLSVALNAAGELVVVVMGDSFSEHSELINMISSLEQWLAPMDLRDLGELSGNPNRFVDGLWELSPRTPLNLASLMRVLLVNPGVEPDPEVVRVSIPFSRVEVLRVEALQAADGSIAIRRLKSKVSQPSSSDRSPVTLQLDSDAPMTSTAPSPDDDILLLLDDDTAFEAESVFADAPPEPAAPPEAQTADPAAPSEVIDLTIEHRDRAAEDAMIDELHIVDHPARPSASHDPAPQHAPTPTPPVAETAPVAGEWPTIIRGLSYVTAELPLHFDATASRIEPICDELFAVGPHIVLVVDLDDQVESPLETASIFRWETVSGKRQLFDLHALDAMGRRRTVHIFVEGGSQPNRVFSLGTAKLLTQTDRSGQSGLWFKLDAAVDARPLAILQHGRLPGSEQRADRPTFSFASAHPGPPTLPGEPAHAERPNNWVPNV